MMYCKSLATLTQSGHGTRRRMVCSQSREAALVPLCGCLWLLEFLPWGGSRHLTSLCNLPYQLPWLGSPLGVMVIKLKGTNSLCLKYGIPSLPMNLLKVSGKRLGSFKIRHQEELTPGLKFYYYSSPFILDKNIVRSGLNVFFLIFGKGKAIRAVNSIIHS